MLRKPTFWIIFTALSFAAAAFTFKNFSTAFPLVSIDLRMDRAAALRAARDLAQKRALPGNQPTGFDQAAEFTADQEVQNFIELEGGGKPELARILKEKIFAPYRWHVRFFKQGDAHEALLRFTPEGDPYGFAVKLPDDEKGASLSPDDARRIAEDEAKSNWSIDFARYQLAESSNEVRPGGRTDHTFVYERQDARAGEGRYRLRLVVAGEKLTELTHFLRIPQAFTRRYEQMRSANDAIGAASSIAVFALYILGFCGIGLFFMMRRRWVLWRQAARWGVLIGLLMGLQQLNSWPLAWMSYDTAVPAAGFAVRQILTAFGVFVGLGILLLISFMAAETLSRRAFPHHVQLWRVWSTEVAASKTVFGETLAGYLLVAPFFAYEIVLYFFAQEKLGWWTPSDTLVNPDMFANFLPSLSAIAQAAQAGFWEESLFRAVPLATAALIGQKLGMRRLFIGGGMVLQALVFASGHAGYANQPAYARVVELIIPSFVFGIVYLLFGLLPGIVLHFAYDTVWMALPLFVASGARAHVEQGIVIVAVLIPLWIVFADRLRARRWTEVPADAINGSWSPPEQAEAPPRVAAPAAEVTPVPALVLRLMPVAGVAALIVWIFTAPFRTNAPPIEIDRSQAEQIARQALAQRGMNVDSSWTALSHVEGQPGEINRFVWQTAGRSNYEKLLGVYVTPPCWVIRFVRFSGDVAERAEEYEVYINGSGQAFRVSHELPEAKPGKNLAQEDARSIATSVLDGADRFKEVAAHASKHPARTDWTFEFKDVSIQALPEGEARVAAEIAGDQVSDTYRYVYVPEEWSRNERSRRNIPSLLATACTIALVTIVVAGAIIGAVHWSRGHSFRVRAFLAVFAAVFLLGAVNVLNGWPVFASRFSTAQPFALQLGTAIATSLVFGLFTAAGLGLVAGLIASAMQARSGLAPSTGVIVGISTGLVIAAAGTLARGAMPSLSPLWGNLAPQSTYFPFAATALAAVGGFFTQTLILFAVLYGAQRARNPEVLWVVAGLALAGSQGIESIVSWLIIGLSTGLVLALAYRFVFRYEPYMLVIATTTLAILAALRDGLQRMYPVATVASVTGAVMVVITAMIWFRGTIEPRSGARS